MGTSKIAAAILQSIAERPDMAIVAENDDYFLYSEGSLEPGPFGSHYGLRAATLDGERFRLAEASLDSGSRGLVVNLGPTSSTSDVIELRAKADILTRLATLLAERRS